MHQMEPALLAESLYGLEGKWVAVKDRRVVAASDTPDGLYQDLHARQIRGAMMLRVPGEHDPEMVGLG